MSLDIWMVVERLKERCPSLGERVFVLTDIREIENLDTDIPAAFVVREGDTPQAADGAGHLVSHAVERSFSVIYKTRVPEHGREPMEEVRDEGFEALIGWMPQDQTYRVEYAAGEAQPPAAGVAGWIDTFSYTQYRRYQSGV